MISRCKRCGERRSRGSGDIYEVAIELIRRAESLRLLCEWDQALRGMEWPNILNIATRCSSVGELGHSVVHGSSADQDSYRVEYLTRAQPAIQLLEKAHDIERTLLAQLVALSPSRVYTEWVNRYLLLNPDLARQVKRSGIALQ